MISIRKWAAIKKAAIKAALNQTHTYPFLNSYTHSTHPVLTQLKFLWLFFLQLLF